MSAARDLAREFLAAAHEPRKYLVAVDIRSGNIGRPAGVVWVETEIAISAIASAIEARSDAAPKSDAAEGESAAPSGETPND